MIYTPSYSLDLIQTEVEIIDLSHLAIDVTRLRRLHSKPLHPRPVHLSSEVIHGVRKHVETARESLGVRYHCIIVSLLDLHVILDLLLNEF